MTNEQDKKLQDHERIEALMPWIKNGKVDEAELDLIGEELLNSPAFQDALEHEGALGAALEQIAALEAQESNEDADDAWNAFKARLPETQANHTGNPAEMRLRSAGKVRASRWRSVSLPKTGLGWLASVQAAALAAVAFLFVSGTPEPAGDEYRTLSSGEETAVSAGNAVLVFTPSADQTAMHDALNAANARIVDGPMANGGYVIEIKIDDLQAGLDSLKANDAVVLAESLNAGEQP